jgi:hypothetical protein
LGLVRIWRTACVRYTARVRVRVRARARGS